MIRWTKLAMAALAAALVVGCATPNPVQRLPDITFAHKPALRMDVAAAETVSKFTSPLAAPNVEHLFPTSPDKAMRRWVRDRVTPVGAGGTAVLTILNAAATEEKLPRTEGVKGSFTNQQAARYTAFAEAMLEIRDASGRAVGVAEARVSRTRTIAEDATLNQRDEFWWELTRDLMADFDTEMEAAIRRHLVNWIR